MKLSCQSSALIINELSLTLGEHRTQEILSVTVARLRAFSAGRGRLSLEQLNRITTQTGKAWERWAVDAGARRVKTTKGQAFVAQAHAMWNQILGSEKAAETRRPGRRSKSRLRQIA
jgi:hypothetical protein